MVQDVFRFCQVSSGHQADEPLQARKDRHERAFWLEKREVPDRNARGWKVEGEKDRVTRKECKWLKGE